VANFAAEKDHRAELGLGVDILLYLTHFNGTKEIIITM